MFNSSEDDDDYEYDTNPSDMINNEKEEMRIKPYTVYTLENGESNKMRFETRKDAYEYFHNVIVNSDPSKVIITICVPTPNGIGGHLGYAEKTIERWYPDGKNPLFGRYGSAF